MDKRTTPPNPAPIGRGAKPNSAIRALGKKIEADFRAAAIEAVEDARSKGVPISVLGSDGKVVRVALEAADFRTVKLESLAGWTQKPVTPDIHKVARALGMLNKVEAVRKLGRNEMVRIISSHSTILPQFVGRLFIVYDSVFIGRRSRRKRLVRVTESMVGRKFGEFLRTRLIAGHIKGTSVTEIIERSGTGMFAFHRGQVSTDPAQGKARPRRSNKVA